MLFFTTFITMLQYYNYKYGLTDAVLKTWGGWDDN